MTQPAWAANLRAVTPYTAGEQPRIQNLVKLNTNENPYGPSPHVAGVLAEAGMGGSADELRLYPDPDATRLRDALAAKYGLRSEQVFLGNGSDEVLALCFLAFFNGPRPIVFPDVTYSFYPVWCDLFGIPYSLRPLTDDFTIEMGAFNVPNGGVVFPNPNAPTGLLVGLDFIRDVLEHNTGSVVVLDEAYIDFGGTSAIPLMAEYDNLVIVQTFSKSRSLAGSRIGFALGSPIAIAKLGDVKNSFNSYPLDTLTQSIGLASVEDEAYFTRQCQRVAATREAFKKDLVGLGFIVPDSYANFVFVRHPAIPGAQLFADLRAAGIVVRHWDKPRIGEYLRISIGSEQQMGRVIEFLRDYCQTTAGKGS